MTKHKNQVRPTHPIVDALRFPYLILTHFEDKLKYRGVRI